MHMRRLRCLGLWITAACAFAGAPTGALAAFAAYTSESAWRDAAGTTALETFESYAVGTQFSSLPGLGVVFAEVAGGGYPVIYRHFEQNVTPYGSLHLANFPQGINAINRYAPIVMMPADGLVLTALGYYNGDGQAATMVATAYDSSDNVLGSIGAFKGAFAGFVSTVPVSRVVFGGITGDGWNHIDGLQSHTAPVPEASALSLLAAGLAVLLAVMVPWQQFRLIRAH